MGLVRREAGRAAMPSHTSRKPPGRPGDLTSDLGCEGAARDVLVIVLDQDAVVAREGGQVGHCARPVFVVDAADFSL